MSDAATKQDLKQLREDLRGDMRAAADDVTALLRTFIDQVDERFNRVEEEQRNIHKDINRLFDYMDKIAKRQEINDEERLVIGHHLDRLDRWTHELADKIGYSLNP